MKKPFLSPKQPLFIVQPLHAKYSTIAEKLHEEGFHGAEALKQLFQRAAHDEQFMSFVALIDKGPHFQGQSFLGYLDGMVSGYHLWVAPRGFFVFKGDHVEGFKEENICGPLSGLNQKLVQRIYDAGISERVQERLRKPVENVQNMIADYILQRPHGIAEF